MDQTSKFCPVCRKPTLWARPGTNHILHLLLTVLLCGFWLPVWLLASIRIGGWRCQTCGYKGSLASRFLVPAGCVVLFLVVLSIIARDTGRGASTPRTDGSRTEAKPAEPTQAERKRAEPTQPEVNEPQPKQPETKPKVFNERETVHVGYTSYCVWRSWWSNRLSQNPLLNQRPNARFLFVELTVRNNDSKPRMVPPFTLIDTAGAAYEASPHGWAVEGSIGVIETLNPSVSKQGVVVFDVPEQRDYRLKLSGGYWSLEDAYVQLTPHASSEAALEAEQHRQQQEAAAERARQAEEKRKAEEIRKAEDEAAKWRTWKDSTGKFTVEARFSGMAFGKVKLTKKNGTTLEVPLERLSEDDQKWLEDRKKKKK